MEIFSFGGGVQSMAALVLAKQGALPIDYFVFANVGKDSESPYTLTYLREVAIPYAQRNGIQLVEVRHVRRDGGSPTLRQTVIDSKHSIRLPMRYPRTGKPMGRSCTNTFKIAPINRFVRSLGATRRSPVTVNLGISWDEAERVNDNPRNLYTRIRYPLVERKITREMCVSIILAEGLPVPPKSACWFCPFTSKQRWQDLRASDPALFDEAANFEALLIDKATALKGHPVYLTRFGKPLRDAIPLPVIHQEAHVQAAMPFFDGCESGYCMV